MALILGDNIFYGHGLSDRLLKCAKLEKGGIIFGYLVKHPKHYGVVEFDKEGDVIGIEEKPEMPKSKYAVPGLYYYDNDVVEIAEGIKPSARGEMEITDINLEYMRRGRLRVELFGRGFAWLDTGTHESLLQANDFVKAIQDRQGLKISCIEEIAYRFGYIDEEQLKNFAHDMIKNDYGQYLMEIVKNKENKENAHTIY